MRHRCLHHLGARPVSGSKVSGFRFVRPIPGGELLQQKIGGHPPGPATWHRRRCVNHSGIANAPVQAGAFDFVRNRSILKDSKVPPLRKAATLSQNAKMTGFWGVQQQHSAYPCMWGRRTAKGGSKPAYMGVAQKSVRKTAPISRGLLPSGGMKVAMNGQRCPKDCPD
jgi:hypothetical protein